MSRTRFFLSKDGKVVADQTLMMKKSEVDKLIKEVNDLRADNERLLIILQDLVPSAKRAMNQANRDGAEWDIKDELSDAYAALDAARKAQP